MWITEYEADVESDLSAFHRIDDPMTISGPRYFSLAVRLSAYAGVMAARAEQRRQDEEKGVSRPHVAGASASAPDSRPSRVSDAAALAMLSDGWVEHEIEEGS